LGYITTRFYIFPKSKSENIVNTYNILLRGVNVGGKNLLPMKKLAADLEESGFEGVKTYIQSGNIVLKSAKDPEQEIGSLILDKFGFIPDVLVLSNNEFTCAVSENPYQEQEAKTVYLYFCKEMPKADPSKLEAFSSVTESYELNGKVFYLHAPDAINTSSTGFTWNQAEPRQNYQSNTLAKAIT